MAGGVLARKEEGGNLWQQPVIAQGLTGVGVPAPLGLLSESTLPHKQPHPPFWNLASRPCWKGDGQCISQSSLSSRPIKMDMDSGIVPDVEQVAGDGAAEQLPGHCSALHVCQQLPHEAVILALVRLALPDTLHSKQHRFLEHIEGIQSAAWLPRRDESPAPLCPLPCMSPSPQMA